MVTLTANDISTEWRALLCEIPGYDPFADAEGCWFDPDTAQLYLDFFPEMLTHIEGAKAGQPFILEIWQQAVIANLFGWKRWSEEHGCEVRRYRKVLMFIPRKNGKTPIAAAIIVAVMTIDPEHGKQIYGAASEYGQASYVWRHAAGMVRQNPALRKRFQIYKGQSKSIVDEDDFSAYRVISADPDSAHGGNTSLAVVDELHTLPNRDLIDAINTSTVNRVQPLIVYLTTSDYERPESICNEVYDRACQVRDGVLKDPTFLPVIYEAPKDADCGDPEVWALANPNLGVSVSREAIVLKWEEAKDSPPLLNTFKRLHLNIRTDAAEAWISFDQWARCNGMVDIKSLLGRVCYGGLDLAATSDATCLALWFPMEDEPDQVLLYCWMPRATATKRENKNSQLWRQWIATGLVTPTEGNSTDYDVVRRDITGVMPGTTELTGESLADKFDIREIAVDRNFQGQQLMMQLQDDGLEVVPFGQGFMSMAAPTRDLYDLVVDGNLNHGCNPVLTWMIGNVMVETSPAGTWKPSKKASSQKIDGAVATIMALGRATVNREEPSPYDGGKGLLDD